MTLDSNSRSLSYLVLEEIAVNVLCHHCYHLFPYRGIRALCTSGACSDVRRTTGHRAKRRIDPEYERLWRRRGSLLDFAQPCPYCREPDRLIPACPECWHELDPDIGQVEDRMIAILGARRAGKSHFLAALFHKLLHEDVGGDAWKVETKPRMRQIIRRDFLRPLFNEQKELAATAPSSQESLRLVLTNQKDSRRVVLRFEDHSGEAIADQELLAEAHFLRHAAGVILLADPLAFEPTAKGPRRGWHHKEPTCLDILENYRRVLQAAPRRPEDAELPLRPEQKSLAVVVTKADLVLQKKHTFWKPPTDNNHLVPGFWQSRSAESEAAAAWLRQRLEEPEVFDETTELFAETSHFFTSSFGYAHKPTAALRKPPIPLRVHEPLFALLDRFANEGGPTSRPGKSVSRRPHVVTDDDVL